MKKISVYHCVDAIRPLGELTPQSMVRRYLAERASDPLQVPMWQVVIDKMLKDALSGTEPRLVFSDKPRRGKQGSKDPIRALITCAEFMRLSAKSGISERERKAVTLKLLPSFVLTARGGLSDIEAAKLVADAFGLSPKTVGRNVTEHCVNFEGHRLDNYIQNLGALISRTKWYALSNGKRAAPDYVAEQKTSKHRVVLTVIARKTN